ncbi:MAG: aminotransferase, partial [Candidatus Pacebacteria bacterium]|nr:aminotransferase [Candidatus Paceibacterota bacterium]
IVFNENVLNEKKTLPTENSDIQKLVDRITQNVPLDKRFVYYLMASAGICVVPLSGLSSDLDGFRITLLEPDEKKFEKTIKILAGKIKEYINS